MKNLTDFRHIILQPARKFNPKFLRENLIHYSFKEGVLQIKHSFTSSIYFLPNPIFSVIIIHIQVCIHCSYTQPPKSRFVESITFRSSHQRCSVREDALKNFAKLTGKDLCQSLSLIKLLDLTCNFIVQTLAQVFSCEFCEISKNTFFKKTPLGDCFCTLLQHTQIKHFLRKKLLKD